MWGGQAQQEPWKIIIILTTIINHIKLLSKDNMPFMALYKPLVQMCCKAMIQSINQSSNKVYHCSANWFWSYDLQLNLDQSDIAFFRTNQKTEEI